MLKTTFNFKFKYNFIIDQSLIEIVWRLDVFIYTIKINFTALDISTEIYIIKVLNRQCIFIT